MTSTSLKIREIEEFEDNPRLTYDEGDMAALVESIKARGPIDEISVFHVKKGDRYVIADGHRTRRAMLEVYGPDHPIEVIVRKEFEEYDEQCKKELLEIGFVTSTLKKNLNIYEELKGVKNYIASLQRLHPNDPGFFLSQQRVYEPLGFKKSKAMQLADMMATVPEDLWSAFETEGVGTNLLKAFTKLMKMAEESGDGAMVTEVVGHIRAQEIKTPSDLASYVEARTEIDDHLPAELPDREEKLADLSEKSFKEKKAQKEKEEEEAVGPQKSKAAKHLKELKSLLKSLHKSMTAVKASMEDMTPEEKEEYANVILQLGNLIQNG